MTSIPIVAALDTRRFHWSTMTLGLWPVGAFLFLGGIALSGWAMGTNPHFEGTVRIQKDRAHRVIESGPYRYIRHPGYLGLILWALGMPFALGSYWACAPAGFTAAYIVLRTALEDRFLRRNLAGYPDYAARVRSRLLPGIW